MTTATETRTNGHAEPTAKPKRQLKPQGPAPSFLPMFPVVGTGVRKGATVQVETKGGKVKDVEIAETFTVKGATFGIDRNTLAKLIASAL